MCFCIFHHPVQMRFPDRTVQDKPEVPEKPELLCMQPLSDIYHYYHSNLTEQVNLPMLQEFRYLQFSDRHHVPDMLELSFHMGYQ